MMKNILLNIILIFAALGLFAQAPSIVFPKYSQVISESNVEFQWDEEINADSYQIQIATDSIFQVVLMDSISIQSGLSYGLSYGLNPYYFRVRTNIDGNQSQWSSITNFFVYSPQSNDSLKTWYRSDEGVQRDSYNKVSKWKTYTNSDSVLQSDASFMPTFIDKENLSSVKFLGDSYLRNHLNAVNVCNNSLTVFFAVRPLSNDYRIPVSYSINAKSSFQSFEVDVRSASYGVWKGNFGQYNSLRNYTSDSYDNRIITSKVKSNDSIILYKDGTIGMLGILPYNSCGYTKFCIGGRIRGTDAITNLFKGEIYEYIYFQNELNNDEIAFVNSYLIDRITPPVNLGQNILRRYGFCDTTLSTKDVYESYSWSTGAITREINIAKEDTGWYWCDVPNLYGEIMRDSIYVYELVGKPELNDTLICLGDSVEVKSISTGGLNSAAYTYIWTNSLGVTVSTDSVLWAKLADTYFLQISDTNGCFITDSMQLFVDSFPAQASLGSDLSVCTGDKIGLVSGQAQADSFLWSTGSSDSIIEVYTAGTYSVIVRNYLDCVAKDTIEIEIHGITPMVNFSADTVCLNDSTIFIDASQSQDASNLINWTWNFNDGSSPINRISAQPFNYLLPDSGTYNVKLTVSTDSNCSNYTYKNIFIRPLPQPNFITSNTCEKHNTEFINTSVSSNDPINKWKWVFYDGIIPKDTLSILEPIYYYNSNGNNRVDLIATSENNCTDSISKTINIKESPIANFSSTDVCDGDSISFIDLSTSIFYNPIVSREWIFNLEDTSNLINPKYLFDSAYVYNTSLRIVSQNSCWDSISKMLRVNAIPVADFISDSSCLDAVTGFYNQSIVKDDTIKSYYWNFNSFANSDIENPEIIFRDTNLQQISLKVVSGMNCIDSISKFIKTHSLAETSFSFDKEYGDHPFDVQFDNKSNNATSYYWDFDDGFNSILEDPIHTFTDSLIYNVKLISTNTFTCSDSAVEVIYGIYVPNDIAIISAPAIEKNDTVSFYCDIINNAQQRIRDIKLTLTYNDSVDIIEYWHGELLPGNSIIYDFTTEIYNYRKDTINTYSLKIVAFNNTEELDTINNIIDNSFFINASANNSNTVSLIYPKNKQTIGDNSINFQWNPALNAIKGYNLQYSTDSLFSDSKVNVINVTENLYYCEDLEIGERYWWRVRSVSDTIYSDWSDSWMFNYFNPKSIDSLVLWLAADYGVVKDLDGRVSQWNDLSGLNHNAFQTDTALQPNIQDNILLNKSAIYFNDDQLLGDYADSIDFLNQTMFVLESNDGSLARQTPFGYRGNSTISYQVFGFEIWNNNGSYKFYFGDLISHIATTVPVTLSSNFELAELTVNSQMGINIYNNANLLNNSVITKQPGKVKNYILGSRYPNGNALKGYIPEVVIYNKVLSDSSRNLVENYIKDKYTPPINLGANIQRRYGFCDTILSTMDMYESYSWSTGNTSREISVGKAEGWYWCDVPNLYGEIMRDSVYVYDLVGKPELKDTLICLGDSIGIKSISTGGLNSKGYTYIWQNSLGEVLSTDSVLWATDADKYFLQISDTNGCYITDSMQLFVDSFPMQASLGSDPSVCTGNKIGLVSGQAQADSFLWSTGSSDSLIEIFTAGTYSLIVRDSLNCVANDTILVDIHGVTPMVSFMVDTVCFKDSSLFVDASQSLDASNLVDWEWDFNDGSLPLNRLTAQPFNYLLPDSGTYNVKLTVSTDSNCTNYAYKNIYIRPLPQPNFFPITACENHELNFENLSIAAGGEILTYYWDFGTGDTSIQHADTSLNPQIITYVYSQVGNYNTILKADNIYGCSDSIIKTVNIKPTPKANFSNSVSCEGVDISFADNSITESFLPINAWMWRFTDVDSSMIGSPIHHYDTAGFYPVNLKVTSINGCWDTITKVVQLHAIPEADFSNDTACINATVNFTEASTIDDGSINYYYWLQDGIAFSADQNSSFIFGDSLEHNVVLKVRTTALCEDSISRIVKVHPRPIAAFTTDRLYGLPPLTVGFINETTTASNQQSSLMTYEWYFGDGANSYDENPLHTYNDSAIFYPKLFAFNKFGCLDSAFGVVYAVYSAVDVSVSQIKAEIKDGYISYSCRISNLGKQKLTQLELSAKYNSGLGVSEQWQGELNSGEYMDYVFNSKSQVPSGDQVQYFCIEAQVTQITEQEDENMDNNSDCKDISTDFWVSTLYPNPATTEINIDIILPYSQSIEIELIDLNGKVLKSSSHNGQKGLNNIKLPIQTLPSAQYKIQIISNQGREVRGFIK